MAIYYEEISGAIQIAWKDKGHKVDIWMDIDMWLHPNEIDCKVINNLPTKLKTIINKWKYEVSIRK